MIKFLDEKIENFCDFGPGKKFLGKTLKAPKEKLINWISSEWKPALQKTLLQELKDKP